MKTFKLEKAPTAVVEVDANLNPQQKAVVVAQPGPMLVIAGAGSGKTHTLTHRVAYLLKTGVSPDRVMLLTFTNRAAREMTNRVSSLVNVDARRLWSGTFHSLANRTLRRHIHHLGYPDNYVIMDQTDQSVLMSACLAEAVPERLEKHFPRGNVLSRMLTYCVNTQSDLDSVLRDKFEAFTDQADEIREVFHLYRSRKFEMSLVDFDDLLYLWQRLLLEHEDVYNEISEQFEHILVDEYQDTNKIQGDLIDILASKHRNLMVVGDDCQAIYGFRGAEFQNILEFQERYPDARVFKIEQNYRSTPQILELTNQSIQHNKKQHHKTLTTANADGELPGLVRLRDVYQQAEFISQYILQMMDEGESLDEIAVLYRAHYHAMELQLELSRRGIPFVVRSGTRYFEQAHIKDILSYMRFATNPKDELSFLRIAQHVGGVGVSRAHQVWELVSDSDRPYAKLLDVADELPKRVRKNFEPFAKLVHNLGTNPNAPSTFIDAVVSSSYQDFVRSNFENPDDRLADLEQLGHYAAQFESTDGFLREISLTQSISGQDIQAPGAVPSETLTLSSVHQAKGLEWNNVFVLWLSDGHFPSTNAADTEDGKEEERRLFYVATTRARRELLLCHVVSHQTRDGRKVVLRPSDFVEELPKSVYENWTIET